MHCQGQQRILEQSVFPFQKAQSLLPRLEFVFQALAESDKYMVDLSALLEHQQLPVPTLAFNHLTLILH